MNKTASVYFGSFQIFCGALAILLNIHLSYVYSQFSITLYALWISPLWLISGFNGVAVSHSKVVKKNAILATNVISAISAPIFITLAAFHWEGFHPNYDEDKLMAWMIILAILEFAFSLALACLCCCCPGNTQVIPGVVFSQNIAPLQPYGYAPMAYGNYLVPAQGTPGNNNIALLQHHASPYGPNNPVFMPQQSQSNPSPAGNGPQSDPANETPPYAHVPGQ